MRQNNVFPQKYVYLVLTKDKLNLQNICINWVITNYTFTTRIKT